MRSLNQFRILFVSTFSTPFIQEDLEFLKTNFQVKTLIGSGIFQVFKIIVHCFTSDIVYCWFGSTYASLAVAVMKFLGKSSLIVVAGADVAYDKTLGYGIWLIPWKARLLRYAFNHADKITAVDESLAEKARTLGKYDGNNIEIVPTGYDVNFWNYSEKIKTQYVLTVATGSDERRLRVKGIDVLIETARILSHINFTIIGIEQGVVAHWNIPFNVHIIAAVARKQLLPYYQRAEIYCQPSRHEGMSNVLCEAMLCGCQPVATDVGGTRTILNGVGFLVSPGDATALADALRQALSMEHIDAGEIRKRVAERFTISNRKERLLQILQQIQK
jgi:glycosyltransferase involved in cell wall biosynthesis